ncbi:MarR family transcriptional regulator [Anaerotignum sp.]
MNQSIARKITLLGRKSQTYIGTALAKYGLTAAEQPFFMALQHQEGITQEELTAIVGVDKAVTTRVVKSLEKKGLLERIQDKRDRRKNLIYPTEKARRLEPLVKEELHAFNRLLTQGIEEETLEMVYEALLQMEGNFVNMYMNKNIDGGTAERRE